MSLRKSAKRFFKNLIVILVTPITVSLVLFLLVALVPLLVWRLVAIFYVKYFRKDIRKILNPRSTIMTLGSVYNNPRNILVVPLVLKGKPNIQEFRNKFAEAFFLSTKLCRFPELQENLTKVMGFYFWRKVDNFKIEDHIYEHPSSSFLSSIDSFLVKPWNDSKPLWEIVILRQTEEQEAEGTFTTLFRFHHGLVDGFSILQIFQCLDSSKHLENFLNDKMVSTQKSKTPFMRNLMILIRSPFDLTHTLLFSESTEKFLPGQKDLSPFEDIKIMTETKMEAKASRAFVYVPFSQVKTVKTLYKTGMNPLLCSIFSAGVSKFFCSNRHLADTTKTNKHPKVLLRFPLPLGNRKNGLRNHMTFGSLSVKLMTCSAEERLDHFRHKFQKVSRSTMPLVMSFFTVVGGSIPQILLSPWVNRTFEEDHIFVTNFPAPLEGFHICDCPMVKGHFASSVAGTRGIVFTVTSFKDTLSFFVSADKAILRSDEEANTVLEYCMQELSELRRLRDISN